ncbi:MAG TPA: hypothetical protein VMS40_08010 [Vicinamibacterales bacterium]|nr:hypothetical protein [Vicinamibacterales bacterium]
MLRRKTLTASPPAGDYILSPTGYSWGVRRSIGEGSAQSIAGGERKKAVALAQLVSLAETDKTDAWETVGTGVFWLLRRFRPALTP